MSRYKKWFVFLLILGCFTSTTYADSLKKGQRAPNLTGFDAISSYRVNLFRVMTQMNFKRDKQGKLVLGKNGKYISEFTHNVVVLNFFAKTCIPCLREIPTFNQVAEKFRGERVKFLYVNVDPNLNKKQTQDLIRKHGIEIPVLLPNQKEAIRKYGANRLPRLVVIGKNKRVVKIFKGFHENLEETLTRQIKKLL